MNDNTLDNEPTLLISKIKKAFAKMKYPGDDNLVDNYSSEELEYKEAFQRKDWRGLSLSFVCPQFSEMAFFSAQAFRYYLPGYMILCIQHLDEVDVMAPFLVGALTLPERGSIDWDVAKELELTPEEFESFAESENPSDQELLKRQEWFHRRCDPLTLEQKQAVIAFLDWLTEYGQNCFDDEPEIAVKRYWGRYY
jgi:hypothetical protein